ncbi:uncharacterized protein LOC127786839 [Diospyros lotus]|uniref:uncharacterized protein LOC127786839 n=1 Tax=Diospyros lotus TaxID=55363 RepID=UPI00225ABCFB|nr:uncharacterized protein LOC127786839 [Diospyros lotus]
MGCFLACFGSSKDRKRKAHRKNKNKVLPRDQGHGSHGPSVASEPESSAAPTNLISEQPVEEQLSLNTRRKVTFDTNVKTYEPVPVRESTDFLPETEKETDKKEEESSGKSSLCSSHSLSEDESTISSVGSYPSNHRYQNCRDSDDEAEELDCEDSDLDDEGEELEDYGDYDEEEYEESRIAQREAWSESIKAASMEGSTEMASARAVTEEVDKRNARDRSVYVHSVLNPVENLSQWKAVKSKAIPPLKPQQKENFIRTEQEEARVSFSSDPILKPKSDKSKNQNQQVAVDASLSNWLVSPETITASNRSVSQCSSSVVSVEDRPILGALTVEEIRQFSASSYSPRRSPSWSPDEKPIIGTVGRYWSHSEPAMDAGSASSKKGIPNTTSKYRREDKRVNWNSTPFETRLERALDGTIA